MTEAPDVYPEFPDDDAPETDDESVEGLVGEDAGVTAVRTGDPRVDEVLTSLEGLEARPLREHADVFSQAHEQLRAALDPDRESA